MHDKDKALNWYLSQDRYQLRPGCGYYIFDTHEDKQCSFTFCDANSALIAAWDRLAGRQLVYLDTAKRDLALSRLKVEALSNDN